MPAVGPRALLPATRTRPLSRAAGDGFHARRANLGSSRAFRASPLRPSRPDGPNGAGESGESGELPDKAATDDSSPAKADENNKPAAGEQTRQDNGQYKEYLRSQGYGSAKVRALRGKTAEENPPPYIPPWFTKNHTHFPDPRRCSTARFDGERLLRETAKVKFVDASEVDAALKNFHILKVAEFLYRLRTLQTLYPLPPPKRRGHVESLAYKELLAAARTELTAVVPPNTATRRPSRPVTVLSVLNYKGRSVAGSVVRDVAAVVGASVVHLDASSISRVVGSHLGQTPYWSRSSIPMLGYAAAETNGRLLTRVDASAESEDAGGLFISLPPRVRSLMPTGKRDNFLFGGGSDERWEDIKLNRILEEMISVTDDAKDDLGDPRAKNKDLIVHLHDYLELGSVAETLVSKIRSIVDRMWQGGRRVIIIGSSSSDIHASSQWRSLLQTSRDECHVIPFHSCIGRAHKDALEKAEAVRENLDHISAMLKALVGSSKALVCKYNTYENVMAGDRFPVDLSKGVYDVHWVYRVASLMLGSELPQRREFDTAHLEKALETIAKTDKEWMDLYTAQPPYFSPIFAAGEPEEPIISSDREEPSSDKGGGGGGGSGSNSSANKNYDSHEKKLLSGLINAKDIHTTFDDIVAPESTKESLIALTTLSLVRPKAFTYGVLKTERIPGCLLYGPPGTGKTLLARAVAKGSGANMLEVSAASINDMYVGQSEKNVRALFSLARKLAPAVIFLDEADALLASRQSGPGGGRAAHRETITQFLREWDGLTSDMKAFIMVATNRPFDLDEAVLRRLPRRMLVDLPLPAEREAILRVILRDEHLDHASVSLADLARQTDLYSGSDLKNLCVSAAMHAVRDEVRAAQAQKKEAAAAVETTATTEKTAETTMATAPKGSENNSTPPSTPSTPTSSPTSSSAPSSSAPATPPSSPSSSSSSPTTTGSSPITATKKEKEEDSSDDKQRILTRAHFDRALAEISASISDDMSSLKAIRKFDEQYGDAGRGRGRRGKKSIGFEVVPGLPGSEEARVRKVSAS